MKKMLTLSQNSNPPKKIVLMLHGFGSCGENLIDFAPFISVPDILYVAPDAPLENDFGYKWFDIGSIDNLDYALMEKGIIQVRSYVTKILDDVVKKYHLPYQDIILFGFSQGGMIALDTLMLYPNIKNAIAVSSAYFPLHETAINKNILLIHGTNDSIVDYEFSKKALKSLSNLGANVTLESCENLDHSINEKGMNAIKQFLNKILKSS